VELKPDVRSVISSTELSLNNDSKVSATVQQKLQKKNSATEYGPKSDIKHCNLQCGAQIPGRRFAINAKGTKPKV
jgi:hypothetical protein